MLTRFTELIDRIGPAVAALGGGLCAIVGILIIVYPVLLAWIAGIALTILGLAAIAVVATGLRWGGDVASDERQSDAG